MNELARTARRTAASRAFAALASGLLLAACAGGGGSSGTGGAAGGATAGTTPPATGPDLQAPVVEILTPARGAHLAPSAGILVEGRAADAPGESGLQSFWVNGQVVAVDGTGHWQTTIAGADGVRRIVARALDRAGNEGVAAVSVLQGSYLAATDPVPFAAASRLNQPALDALAPLVAQAITQSGVIRQAVLGAPLYQGTVLDPFGAGVCIASAHVQAVSISHDPLQIAFSAAAGGLDAAIHLPRLRTTVRAHSTCGIPYDVSGNVSATDLELQLGVDLQASGGRIVATVRSSRVTLHGFAYGIQGIPSAITNLVRSAVRQQLETVLTDELKSQIRAQLPAALATLSQPITRSALGQTVTFQVAPTALVADPQGLELGFEAALTATRDARVPTSPGSLLMASAPIGFPAFAATPDLFASVHQNLLNRTLWASWQAGFWHWTVDDQVLRGLGVQAPLALNGQLVSLFFPALAGLFPPGQSVPLAIRLEPQLPPVLAVEPGQSPLRLSLGELWVTALLDFGTGYQPLLTASLHLEAEASVQLSQSALSFAVDGNTIAFEADLLSSAVPLRPEDVEQFLQATVPIAIVLSAQAIRPIPIPTVQGLTLTRAQLFADGPAHDFLTVSGDVR